MRSTNARFQALSSTLLAGIFLLAPFTAAAKPLQILHTNDLHSYFEQSERPGFGGAAAIKATIDRYRAEAAAQGIETIVLDAGDFSDGTLFRYADRGAAPYKVMDAIGYDAVALGNHDWLIGASQMDSMLGQARPGVPFLAANFVFDPKNSNLAHHIRPYISLEKAGARVAVLGLVTDELIYSWTIGEGEISKPQKVAKKYLDMLRKSHDFVFVLSHLGLKKDIKLAKKLRGIDLIVGGHSHDLLTEPEYSKDPADRRVPIVQVGSSGDLLGQLLVDVEPGRPLKVLDYNVIDVDPNLGKDAHVEELVAQARAELEALYGKDWLYEVLTISGSPLEPPKHGPTIWGDIFAETIKDVARTPAALDINAFYGGQQPAGPVTRETLYNFYPRTFDLSSDGWTVWKVRIPGWAIRLTIELAGKFHGFINTSGITYELKWKNGKPKYSNFRIAGKRLHDSFYYDIGVTEGLGRGSDEISKLLRSFFKPRDTGISLWRAVEEKVRSMHVPQPVELPAAALP